MTMESESEFDWESGSEFNYSDNEGHISFEDMTLTKKQNQFEYDMEVFQTMPNLVVTNMMKESEYLCFTFYCSEIPQEYIEIYNLPKDATIHFKIDFDHGYLTNGRVPTFTIDNAGNLTWSIKNSLENFIRNKIPIYTNIYEEQKKDGKPKYTSKDSLLVNLYNHIKQRINNPGKYCVNCDQPVPNPGLRPITCGRELCHYQYTELGLASNMKDQVGLFQDVIDVLINFTYSAMKQHQSRRDKIFGKIPEKILDITNHNIEEAFQIMIKAIDVMPPVKQLMSFGTDDDLKKALGEINEWSYYMMQWIVTTTTSHLIQIDITNPEFLSKVNLYNHVPKAVFKYLSNPPDREKKFNEIKAKKNVKVLNGFHGSPQGNWHSIIRNSLKNFSGTDKQTHGSAYGSGIYLATEINTSLGYSNGHSDGGWENSVIGKKFSCVVHCDVLDDGGKGITSKSPYLVVNQEELVRTNYLMVF